MKTLRRLFSYLIPYWPTLAGICALTLLVNGLTLLQPLLFRELLTKVLLEKNLFFLKIVVLATLLIVAMKGFFSYAQGYLMNFVGLSCLKKLREEMFSKLQRLPMEFFANRPSGEIFSRVTNDVGILSDVMSTSVVYLANDILVLIGSLGWMLWKSFRLTLVTLIVMPFLAYALLHFGKWMNRVTRAMQAKMADLFDVLFEGVTGIQLVKSFGREEHELARFTGKNEEYFTWGMKSVQVLFTQTPIVEFLAALGISVMVYYGGVQVVKGTLSIGDIFAFWGYMILATSPLYRFSSTLTNLQKAKAAASRVFEVVDAKEEESEVPANPASLTGRVRGEVEYQDVWFRYRQNEPWVLEGVNFTASSGDVVAVVGPSGAGKTSLAALLPRFYKPTRGIIRLDGVDTDRIALSELRSYIGIVSQDVLLLSRSIRENIAYGAPEATFEKIQEAAKIANAHDFIQQLPHGYEANPGERGLLLSAGQRQRIAIARAVLRNPKILILDEATSSLDSESEFLIQQAMERLMRGRTTFIIAHRLSTIRNTDKIIAIEEGKIAEIGSHSELLQTQGLYSRLVQAQFASLEA